MRVYQFHHDRTNTDNLLAFAVAAGAFAGQNGQSLLEHRRGLGCSRHGPERRAAFGARRQWQVRCPETPKKAKNYVVFRPVPLALISLLS